VIPTIGSDARFLALPVRPGDTLNVPEAGNVTVVGWVYKPGVVTITKNMSVLEAISACGGPLFAADVSSVQVIRRTGNGPETVATLNLDDIKTGKATDVQVQANDVIEMPYSVARIPGYALYYAAQGIVSFGPAALVTSGL